MQKEREPVCLFCAIMYREEHYYEKVLKELKSLWGNIYQSTPVYVFSEITRYYEREMGDRLLKKIVVFENLIPLENIHQTKILTNMIENHHRFQGMRQVNIDPGYLTEAKVVLFSTKDFFHRVFIGNNIFGEVTLSYKSKKGFLPLEWTFPDYRQKEILDFFNGIREWYRLILGRKRRKKYHKLWLPSEN